ncbi:MAG: UxaA family hydrolase, partial [Proteobacteria bacterium]|nr:UxaA family hydrolase [Pseudomonadota bacterium]
MHPDDSVAIALQALAIDDRIDRRLKSRDDIPVGHKVAVHDIEEGDPIRKYGHVIGVASRAIRAGQHVHTHNLAYTDDVPGEASSMRGDGDGAEAA